MQVSRASAALRLSLLVEAERARRADRCARARVCTVRSNRFASLPLRPELGPVMQTEPDFGCVEHRAALATV
jgi:hypothetical protein